MYIKSVVIDGFKSYGRRTEINSFDPLFNAITGLNGSGKSNILDSICFLLGITNLSQVRATNLQELVYKNGQAGVTKATVSIVFDNRDKAQSPIGYEQYEEITVTRQVVMGGRNKYLINGCNAQNSRVHDMFHSVQLNVNNPHFLIMQGRITKVLNMKPPEILSMIEEAAGTKLYECKKVTAEKTIEKKEAKLREIKALLDEEITPRLNKLKEERASYLEFQKVQRELEQLTKIHIAYQYVKNQESCKKSKDELQCKEKENLELENKVKEATHDVKTTEVSITEMQKKRNEEEGGKLSEYEKELKACQAAEVKLSSSCKNNADNVKAENKKKTELQKSIEEDSNVIKKKENDLIKLSDGLKQLQETHQHDAVNLTSAQKKFQDVSAGLMSNEDGEAATIADQLMAAKTEIASCETETKQAQMKFKHSSEELKKKSSELKQTEAAYTKDKSNLNLVETSAKNLEKELSGLKYEEGCEEQLTSKRRLLNQTLSSDKDQLDSAQAKFPHLNFEFRNPEPNFDRSKVYGLVCNLFTVKDRNMSRALEVIAGGKLYNVVVDSELTAKKLLQSGNLKRRCTFIPLNKISHGRLSNDVIRHAEQTVGKQNVKSALSLIEFDNRLTAAMEFVFGNAFVCPDMNTAKQVAFHPRVQKRTVTVDGESFDPSGTLSGGAFSQGSSVLLHVKTMKELQQKVETQVTELRALDYELNNIRNVAEKFRGLKHRYNMKVQELELLKQRIQQTDHHLRLEEIKLLEDGIAEQQNTIKRCEDLRKKAEAKVKDLETMSQNVQAVKDRALKQADQEVNKAKNQLENSSKQMKERQAQYNTIELEIGDLKKTLVNYQEQINVIDETLKSLKEKGTKLQERLTLIQAELVEVQAKVKEQKRILSAKDKEIGDHVARQQRLVEDINSGNLQMKKNQHALSKLKASIKELTQSLDHLVKKYEWISHDRKFFGQPNTAYDFTSVDSDEVGRRIANLKETKENMVKKVNMRAMTLLEKTEEQYNDLMQKKGIVENDKVKITSVIQELDEKKKIALTAAWEQVTKDFGSIFSTLLPGTQAKLVPPEGMTVLDGLEVKVAFGNVWKESLGELSGGQRSLVALSLILAMLLFKPAPIYILDEIDAALDLSHTQNIGQMLRTHFKRSQFIVVSLKDGMFNNANVLYKTKFIDGVSSVSRYEQRTSRPIDK